MKYKILGILLLTFPSFAVIPAPKNLDIYTQTAVLTEILNLKVKNTLLLDVNLPKNTDLENLIISPNDDECIINSIQEKEPNKNFENRLKNIENKIITLKNRLEAINTEIALLKNLDINKKENIETVLESFEKKLFEKLEEKQKLETDIKNLEKSLDLLITTYGKLYELKINCLSPRDLTLNFSYFPKVKANQQYVIYGNTVKNSIKIHNKLTIYQETGKDLKNITVNYFTYNKTTSIEPPPFYNYPIVKKTPQRIELLRKPIQTKELGYKETKTKAFFQVKNITLPNKKHKQITISTDEYKANFEIFIDGYATTTPFLTAKFKNTKFYPPSWNTLYYIDGIFLGKGRLPSLMENEENKVYFGEDLFIKTSKILLKDKKKTTLFGKKIHKKEWRYQIKNKHKTKMKIILVDKVPVSRDEKTEIKPFASLKWKEIKPDGKVIWEFYLNPDEETVFKYGYEIIKK